MASNRFAIVVDGTAALPSELAKELDLRVLPLHVIFGSDTYTDGVDLFAERFYELLAQPGAQPTTSQPSIGECAEALEALRSEGNREVLVITIAKELSGTYSAVTTAAPNVANLRVEVVDSRSVAGSIALIGTACARARAAGSSFEETLALARKLAGTVQLLAVIDTLEQLKRSGRASSLQATFGSLLSIKPIITVENGRLVPLEKVRTRDKAVARLKALVEERVSEGRRLHVSTLHTNSPERATELAGWAVRRFDCAEIYTAEAGPVIAAHAGPGVVAICWYPEEAES